tara:strand:+ start:2592 stop:3290 length:699 start_codon:yes stop_codon:yes gene_type:complete
MGNLKRTVMVLVLLLSSLALMAETNSLSFPKLTGRVVDQVGLLDKNVARELETKLQAHETASKNQVVVVILKDLQEISIEEYAYQLGRTWGIGQKGENNGVIMLVVPSVRKVRIEVGYGLEGTLTDALSNNIIQTVILPLFRTGNFEKGIAEGTEAIIQVLGGQYQFNTPKKQTEEPPPWWFIFFLPLIFLRRFVGRGFYGYHGHHGGSHRGGGGFSGGGGSFGGGGASGGW